MSIFTPRNTESSIPSKCSLVAILNSLRQSRLLPIFTGAFLIGLLTTTSSSAVAADNSVQKTSTNNSQSITILNNLLASTYCPNGNTLSVFAPNQPEKVIRIGKQATFSGDFSVLPGIEIQINNWYWVANESPVSEGGGSTAQNPDNSGAQFAISHDCKITQNVPPWFGKGIPSYLIASVSAANSSEGVCVVTVSSNSYTNAVTPGCCSPPGIGDKTCKSSQWGQTANGAQWPPPAE